MVDIQIFTIFANRNHDFASANIQINVETLTSDAWNLRNQHTATLHTHNPAKRRQIPQPAHRAKPRHAKERHTLRSEYGQNDAPSKSQQGQGTYEQTT